ncbi:HD domain-containing protein [Pricia sp.]|uniref:HD domain-containing protein n=1 Tax=Pricia sp. TaxID=2268138 RepID=UPI0035944AB4
MTTIVKKAKKYCIGLLSGSRCGTLPFHNEEHTMNVYENVLKIGMYENMEMEELEPVMLAALFHDTGNATVFAGHENFSATEASNFLLAQSYPYDKIDLVINCIKATRMPQRPKNIYEAIICDADLFHLGINSYHAKNTLLRLEWATFLNTQYSNASWDSLNIEFLQQHRFHTKYGQKILEPVKQRNLRELKEQREKTNRQYP